MKGTYHQYQCGKNNNIKNNNSIHNNNDIDVGFVPSLLLSAAAGSAASFITNPLDLIKLRIQVYVFEYYSVLVGNYSDLLFYICCSLFYRSNVG